MNQKIKFWGWGAFEKKYSLAERPFFWTYLENLFKLSPKVDPFDPDLSAYNVAPSRLSESQLKELMKIVGEQNVSDNNTDRIVHSFGKSYYDLIRIRQQHFDHLTDAVLFPTNEDNIRQIIVWAQKNRCALIPFGGGTSVVGGVEAVKDPDQEIVLTLNLKYLNSVISINKEAHLAEIEAGILGPELETKLNNAGFTLGHFPESFEYSTLGGWIAARSAGQQSTKYGKIEDMVESLRMVTSSGIIESPHYPAAANGIEHKQALIGSEGVFGIIVSARMRIVPVPQIKTYKAYLVDSFANGIEISKKIMHAGLNPATVRLSDATETEFILALRKQPKNFFQNQAQEYLLKKAEKKGYTQNKRAFLLMGLEGSSADVSHHSKVISNIFSSYKVFSFGEKPGKSWYASRFENPYLRDILLDQNLLVDTLETTSEWHNVQPLYKAVSDAISSSFQDLKITGVVTAHLSHLYPSGCSVYFIILASPKPGAEIKNWQTIKDAASRAILNNNASISHHHGIGRDHRKWLADDIGKEFVKLQRLLKEELDPQNIFNPGKLLPDPEIIIDQTSEQPSIRKSEFSFSVEDRRKFIKSMKDDFFDIVVIGGGITGAGILRDAALRGYKAVLIEKDDYASGTSSKSSKLVHGGFRYLKNLEFGLVHEALMERKTLMEIAPHLVHPIECLLPVYKKSSTPGWLIQLGMLLYDGLSFTKRIGTHKLLPIEDLENTEPELRKDGLQKLFMYYDSRADDSRLVMANIQSAAEHGALAANYIKAIDVVQHEDHVLGIKVQDQVSGDEFVIRTKVTANATGPWCDELRNQLFGDGNRRIRTTKGIHLLVKRSDLQIERTMILLTIQDDRPVFAIPWREYVILGTTDTDFDGEPDWVGIDSDDVDYLLKTYNYYYPRAKLTKDKILSVWAGLRPLTFEEGKAAGEVTREYQIFETPQNFFTIIGGKLTTYRTMAEELVDRLADVLLDKFAVNAENAKCRTDKIALFGGDIENYKEFSETWTEKLVSRYKFDKDITLNLIESYGSRIKEVLTVIADTKNGRERIIPKLPYVWGELYYTMQYEMAINLDDFLLRRTHLFSLDKKNALDNLYKIAEIMADKLGWDNSEKQKQIEKYNKKIEMITAFRKN